MDKEVFKEFLRLKKIEILEIFDIIKIPILLSTIAITDGILVGLMIHYFFNNYNELRIYAYVGLLVNSIIVFWGFYLILLWIKKNWQEANNNIYRKRKERII